jgi:hypothetical protein
VSPARVPMAGCVGIRTAAHDTGPDVVPLVSDDPGQGARSSGRPTRITVDLAPDLHGVLRGYARARDVAAADVIRELIRQLKADPGLSSRVSTELERRREALAAAMQAARE